MDLLRHSSRRARSWRDFSDRGGPPTNSPADGARHRPDVAASPSMIYEERSGWAKGPRVANSQECKHNAIMPNVLVRDVPDDVHAALQQRAERRGQSLQQYLAAE